jgi:hypothetical protein
VKLTITRIIGGKTFRTSHPPEEVGMLVEEALSKKPASDGVVPIPDVDLAELESALTRVTVLETEVSSLKSLLQAAEKGASNSGDVEAELQSARIRVAELSDSADVVAYEKLKREVSSLKLLVKEMEMGFTIVWDLDETICIRVFEEGGNTPRIYYLDKEEWIMIRPFTVYVLQKVSTIISNWYILFMF